MDDVPSVVVDDLNAGGSAPRVFRTPRVEGLEYAVFDFHSRQLMIPGQMESTLINIAKDIVHTLPFGTRGTTAFSHDGSAVAVLTDDEVITWELSSETPQVIARFKGSALDGQIAFTVDGNWICSTDRDGNVHFWNLRTKTQARMVERDHVAGYPIDQIYDMHSLLSRPPVSAQTPIIESDIIDSQCASAISKDGKQIAFGFPNGKIICFPASEPNEIRTIAEGDTVSPDSGSDRHVNCMCFSPDGSHLLAAHADGYLRRYSATNPTESAVEMRLEDRQRDRSGLLFCTYKDESSIIAGPPATLLRSDTLELLKTSELYGWSATIDESQEYWIVGKDQAEVSIASLSDFQGILAQLPLGQTAFPGSIDLPWNTIEIKNDVLCLGRQLSNLYFLDFSERKPVKRSQPLQCIGTPTFSPNGRLVACIRSENGVAVFNSSDLSLRKLLIPKLQSQRPLLLAFSADSKNLFLYPDSWSSQQGELFETIDIETGSSKISSGVPVKPFIDHLSLDGFELKLSVDGECIEVYGQTRPTQMEDCRPIDLDSPEDIHQELAETAEALQSWPIAIAHRARYAELHPKSYMASYHLRRVLELWKSDLGMEKSNTTSPIHSFDPTEQMGLLAKELISQPLGQDLSYEEALSAVEHLDSGGENRVGWKSEGVRQLIAKLARSSIRSLLNSYGSVRRPGNIWDLYQFQMRIATAAEWMEAKEGWKPETIDKWPVPIPEEWNDPEAQNQSMMIEDSEDVNAFVWSHVKTDELYQKIAAKERFIEKNFANRATIEELMAKAASTNPSGHIMNTFAVYWYRQGEFGKAIELLGKSRRLNMESMQSDIELAEDYCFLALANFRVGNQEKANEYRKQFFECIDGHTTTASGDELEIFKLQLDEIFQERTNDR